MKRTIVVVAGLLILLALALSPDQSALLAARPAQDATPTPAAEAEPAGTPVAEAESAAETEAATETEAAAEAEAVAADENVAEPTLTELLARLESLEATVNELHAASHATSYAQAAAINTAIYLIDNAGLHGIDVRLNEEETIQPGDAGAVARVARLLTTVEWPASLAADAAALHRTLSGLAAALSDDDLASAAPLATQAHEEQHHFSHHAQTWLAEAVLVVKTGAGEEANAINTAIYFLDSAGLDGAGLHGLDVRLNEEETIQPSDSGAVKQVTRLFTTVQWPDALAEDAAALYETLGALATALENDDLATAAPLATQAHEEQHAFSHHAQTWLAEAGDAGGQANRVNNTIYLLDGAGLHALAERLGNDKDIQSGDSGLAARVARLFTTVDWPQTLAADAVALHETLVALSTALADDDLAAATPLAEEARDAQIELSLKAQEWLSGGQAEGDSHE